MEDFDLDLLPERARHRGSVEFLAETKRLLEQDFAVVGGRTQVEVGHEIIKILWTPPPTGEVRSVIRDVFGPLITVAGNHGYVRRIKFQRMNP